MLKKILKELPYIICGAFQIWLIASFIDVNAHNLTDYAYSWWNMFLYW